MRIALIEHGHTDFDRDHRVHGHLDPALNAEGRAQARGLGSRLKGSGLTVLFASPRRRAATTASIAGRIAGIPVRRAPELAPLNVGRFSGGNEKEVAEKLKPYFAKPDRQIPGGESVGAWKARHIGFARRVAAQGGRPGFVTHSNVIGSLRAAAEGGSDGRKAMAAPPKAASITIISMHKGGGK